MRGLFALDPIHQLRALGSPLIRLRHLLPEGEKELRGSHPVT